MQEVSVFFCGLWFYRSGGYRRHEEGVVHDRDADTVFPPTVREHPPIGRQVGEVSAGVPRQHCGGPDTAGHCQQGRDRAQQPRQVLGHADCYQGRDGYLAPFGQEWLR